jgi:hypothetical protein
VCAVARTFIYCDERPVTCTVKAKNGEHWGFNVRACRLIGRLLVLLTTSAPALADDLTAAEKAAYTLAAHTRAARADANRDAACDRMNAAFAASTTKTVTPDEERLADECNDADLRATNADLAASNADMGIFPPR